MADDKSTTTTDETTVTSQASEMPVVEKQGEVSIDKGADAHVLKEQSSEERLEDARNEGLANHAREHANDEETPEELASNDKVEEDKDAKK